uniref:Zn(2)-C6 fungal-type domain-containing protein n=1 Tax=Kwoniella bestiolae CBS 10118 TaxID=1296100 RepID=A0A1B9FTI1_9TREE|nr:hypothetical protein I302_07714 [Kwoniella bestiolae CBS 10118]OCF22073.1 hypothetical protein I302_07714 [Kwoniella bestiolae CBS 10118]
MTSVQAPRKKRRVSIVTASANTAPDQTISGDETNTGDSDRKIRTSTACRVCRKRKVRCQSGMMSNEGEIGPCSYCVGIDQPGECSYAPPKDRAAFSREYVSKLEKRMALMERQLDKIQPLLDAFQNESLLLNPSVPLPSPSSRPGPITLLKQNATGHISPSLPQRPSVQTDPMGGQDSDTTSEGSSTSPLREHRPSLADEEYGLSLYDENGKPRWIGSHNTFSILNAVSRNHSTTTSRPTTTHEPLAHKPLQQQWALYAGSLTEIPRQPKPTFTLPTESLTFPSKEYAHQLYEAYFEHLYPIMPIMSIRRAREGLDKVFQEKDSLHRIPNEQGDARG